MPRIISNSYEFHMVNIINRRISLLMHDEPTHCLLPCSRLCPYSNIFQPVSRVCPGIEWCPLERHATSNADMEPFVADHYMVFNQHSVYFADKFASSTFDFRMILWCPTSCSPSSSQSSVGSWSFTLLALATRTWPSQLLGHATLLVKTLHNLVCLPGSDQVVLPPPWLGGPAESVKSLVMPANWLLLVWLRWLCCLCIHHTVDVHCLQESSDCFARTSPGCGLFKVCCCSFESSMKWNGSSIGETLLEPRLRIKTNPTVSSTPHHT